MKGFLGQLLGKEEVITIYCDSQSALHFIKSPTFHEISKHIEIKLHFIRDVVSNKWIRVQKIGTESNHTNALTKVLHVEKFRMSMKLVQELNEDDHGG